MADKNVYKSNSQNNDLDDLMAMLDRMQNRPQVKEVEDVLIQQGRPDLVRMDMYSPPTAKDGFVPNVAGNDLEDLLINPLVQEELRAANPPVKKEVKDDTEESLLYGENNEEEDWEALPAPPEKKNKSVVALLHGARMMLPRKGDPWVRTIGKSGFWMGLVALVLVAALLVVDMKVKPFRHAQMCQELQAAYNPDADTLVSDTVHYPAGMLSSFAPLYDRNPQVKGWVSFHAEGKDFLDIEYPFVQGEDNAYYQNRDYDGNESRYGSMYLDAACRVEGYDAADQVLVIHSNNTPDQSLLGSVNRLVGPVDYARAAPELTLSTLYRRDIYYVFAVAMVDGTGVDPFQPIQTEFANEDAFLRYAQSLCARSLFDYPVDVAYDDSLLLLTVSTGEVSTGLTDGRLVVAARRRRAGEMSVQTNRIMKNKDAIMPYSWYVHRDKTLHPFFYSGEEPVDTTTTVGTIPTTQLENPHGTTSTTEDGGNNVGGTVVQKNPTTGGTDGTETTLTGTETTADGTETTQSGEATDTTTGGTDQTETTETNQTNQP